MYQIRSGCHTLRLQPIFQMVLALSFFSSAVIVATSNRCSPHAFLVVLRASSYHLKAGRSDICRATAFLLELP